MFSSSHMIKKNIGDIDVFLLNSFFAICDSGKLISETPCTLWPVRGAYNACICRVGCYGQPVTNTRSSITSLTLLVSPHLPFSSLTLFSFPLSLSFSLLVSLLFVVPSPSALHWIQWRNSHRDGTRELMINFEGENFEFHSVASSYNCMIRKRLY